MNNELFDARYNIIRRDRESSKYSYKKDGGGVIVAVSNKYNCKRMLQWESDFEDIWLTIEIPNHKCSFVLCASYLPPPVDSSLLKKYLKHCNRVFDSCKNEQICMIGDYNVSSIDWDLVNDANVNYKASTLGEILIDFTRLNNFKQHNSILNNKGKILDLVLTNMAGCNVSKSFNELSKNDPLHPTLDIDIDFKVSDIVRLKSNQQKTKLNYHKGDYDSIQAFLDDIDWDTVFSECNNVDDMVRVFYEKLNNAIQQHVPTVKSTSNIKKYPVWFNKNLINLLKEKNKLRRKFKIFKNPLDELSLKLISKRCEKLSVQCYNEYTQHIEDNIKNNPKYFWSYLKSKKKGLGSYPGQLSYEHKTSDSGVEICDMFAEFFSSVYGTNSSEANAGVVTDCLRLVEKHADCMGTLHLNINDIVTKLKSLDISKGPGPDGIPPIFITRLASSLAKPLHTIYNKSLATGSFPMAWKTAKVVPVSKGGDDTLINEYRPISILTIFSKVFELLVYPHIHNHFRRHFSDHQHGFMKSRSTCTNLVSFVEFLSEAIDEHRQVDVVYTDFSKAFDKVDHKNLIKKLSIYGIFGSLLLWLGSYLTDRNFYVVVNGFQSRNYSVTSGVPQGSHLGPILFNIFINDLPGLLQNSTPFLFADDLKLAKVIKSADESILLQNDLNVLNEWCKINGMFLNAKKCFYIRFTRNINEILSTYNIQSNTLLEVTTVRDLGVTLDKKLTFVPHIDHIVKKSNKALGFVLRNSKAFRNPNTKILLYNAFVRSVLEYCSVVWRPHYSTHIARIERIQKRFVGHLSYFAGILNKKKQYADRLDFLKITSLEKRRDLLDLSFLFKIIRNRIDCPQILSKFNFLVPRRLPRQPIKPLCPPHRNTVLGFNSAIPRLSRLLNKCSGSIDIHADSLFKFKNTINFSIN
ncbi:hypothetical protein JYU34_007107 [Plutella xylostella]|uniref:Reverse transcriptase domain-containing protein n=1 Tax=Plutella xylostella TaxID=51655 RepID=A0ABQ7QPK0_PLUXY|nr:hypothetical protein JYU34_007107 [Plutella xylostella]